MIRDFVRETALKIEDEGDAKETRKDRADERAFVQMRVDDLRLETQRDLQGFQRQQWVNEEFGTRGTDFAARTKWNRQ